MKYKEFVDWCNQRAYDGCWGSKEAMICLACIEDVDRFHFWQREKIWKELWRDTIVNNIIKPIHKKMVEVGVMSDEEERAYQKIFERVR